MACDLRYKKCLLNECISYKVKDGVMKRSSKMVLFVFFVVLFALVSQLFAGSGSPCPSKWLRPSYRFTINRFARGPDIFGPLVIGLTGMKAIFGCLESGYRRRSPVSFGRPDIGDGPTAFMFGMTVIGDGMSDFMAGSATASATLESVFTEDIGGMGSIITIVR